MATSGGRQTSPAGLTYRRCDLPGAHDRLADCLPRELLDARLRELHSRVAAHAGAMPSHAELIARYCGEPPVTKQAMSS